VLNAAIHATLGIRKDAVREDSFREPRHVPFVIVSVNRNQHQQTAPNPAYGLPVNLNFGVGYSL
jgi:hypothetical protein